MRKKEQSSPMGRKSGSALIAAIVAIAVLTVLGGSFLKLSLHERQMSARTHTVNSLNYLAEAGLEEGIWAVNNSDWTGWQNLTFGSGKHKPSYSVDLGNGVTANIEVIAFDAGLTFQIYSKATTSLWNGSALEKQMRVIYNPVTNKPGGLLSKGKMDLSGGPMTFDSYDSSVGLPDASTNRTDEVTVGTISTSSGDLSYSSGVDIFGYAGTGGPAPTNGGDVNVYGDGESPNYNTDRIFNDLTHEFPAAEQPSWTGANTSLPSGSNITIGNPAAVSPTRYDIDKIDLSGSDTITVIGPVQLYLSDGMSVSGDARVIVENGGSVEIYSPKDFTFSGEALVNNTTNKRPKNFKLFGTAASANDQTLSISGQAALSFVFDGPNAKANLSGQGYVAGSIVANEVTVSGQIEFHYDVTLGGTGSESDGIASWHDLVSPGHRLNFATYTN